MKYTDLKDKDLAELNSMLKQSKLLLFTARQKLKTMQLSNPNEIRAIKKDNDRINTAIKAK